MDTSEHTTGFNELLAELYRRETDRWLDWKSIERSFDSLPERRKSVKRREFIHEQQQLSSENLSTLQRLLWPDSAEYDSADVADRLSADMPPEPPFNTTTASESGASVVFPREFERTRQLVTEYFGRAITETITDHDVSEDGLVSALAWVQIHLKTGAIEGWLPESTWVCELVDESVGWADEGVWRTIKRKYTFRSEMTTAVQAVHARLAHAIAHSVESESANESGAPVVMVNRRLD